MTAGIDSEHFHGGPCVRHQSFAAGFINGWTILVSDGDLEAILRGQDRRSEAGRAAADDKDIRRKGARDDARA